MITLDSWIALLIAIFFGVLGTVFMKLSDGLTKISYDIYLTVSYIFCLAAMTFAIQSIPLSVAYAVWSGVGTLIVAVIGMIYFNEIASIKKMFYLLLIVIGVLGMNLCGHFT